MKQQQHCLYIKINTSIALKERKRDCTHVDHIKLDDPLPYKIMYTNIVMPPVLMIGLYDCQMEMAI